MCPQTNTTSLVMEYFCSSDSAEWKKTDAEWMNQAKEEIQRLNLARNGDVLDGCVVKVEKAYPVYDSDYKTHLSIVRKALERFQNLQMVGRNGLHKYNNQDHSMLTGLLAARNLAKKNDFDVWRVNSDAEYLEEERSETGRAVPRELQNT